MNIPTLPDGWPIGTYETYQEAQQAVGHLADRGFPVQGITIVGVEPMLVERVAGRLTWGRVLTAGAASGAWMGVVAGVLLSLLTVRTGVSPILFGLLGGVAFGLASAAFRQTSTKGRRDFVSQSQLVARHYDVLCRPRDAECGRSLLAAFALTT